MDGVLFANSVFNLAGMGLLVAWSVGNILLGLYKFGKYDKKTQAFGFWKMTWMWNLVNLTIVVFALLGLEQSTIDPSNQQQIINTIADLREILFANFIVDWFYMLGGFLLAKYGLRKNNMRLVGYGRAIIVQGLFLLVLDLVLYLGNTYFLSLL